MMEDGSAGSAGALLGGRLFAKKIQQLVPSPLALRAILLTIQIRTIVRLRILRPTFVRESKHRFAVFV